MDSDNQYGTLAIQKELLVLLRQFDHLCRKNHIKYSVSSGTLLGTIRHRGFIPWDDDLDVIVEREDYKKLMLSLPSEDLIIEKDSDVILWIDRIRLKDGAFVNGQLPTLDVFILDNCPDGCFSSRIKVLLMKCLQGMMKSHPQYESYSITYKILAFITYCFGKVIPNQLLTTLYQRISSWGNGRKTLYKSLYNDSFTGLSIKYPSDILSGTTRMPFEDVEVSVMTGYDRYLTIIYGDYMTPPDEQERKPSHVRES